ncbi:MAG TPA: adenylate/guanylate cyclase domain-containing protein [Cyanobacteria bacterium UBA11049]|nr:adenylate/guanylate cyclase domain-containing protein [Cyanobacteria bacterium UBA11049]
MWALGKQLWEWRGVWITAPCVAGLLIALRLAGWLQPLELWAFDLSFRLRPQEPTDPRIVIVGIGDSDIDKVGEWHIPDAVVAQLLEKLKKQQPRAIGLDLFRNAPLEPGHQALTKVFETTPNLIGIEKRIGDINNSAIAPNPILKQRGQVASVDTVVDADNKIRRGMLYVTPDDGDAVASLGLTLASIYLEAQGVAPEPETINLQLGKAAFVPFEANDGGYVGADAGGYQILLNFRGSAHSFRTVSMSDVLADRVPPEWVRDRIVLIGATASKLRDLFETPYNGGLFAASQPTPGVEIQANLASQVISAALNGRLLIKVWSEPLEWLWIFAWASIGATLSWIPRYLGGLEGRSLHNSINLGAWTFAIIVLTSGSLGGICYLAFLSGWWIPVVPPALASIGSATAIALTIASLERQDRQTVMNLFGRHVNPEIAQAIWRDRHLLLKQGRLLGRKMTATVLFTDLKDFSSIAEHTDPEVLMCWLNEYMEAMAQLVLDRGGVVDKFIGDSVMAVFGVPLPRFTPEAIAADAAAAVSCALAMAATLKSLNRKWKVRGHPIAAMRVGIATGTVVVGSLGSSQRLDYTTIGDSVNVASRLESYDKSIESGSCRILINEGTYKHIQNKFPTQLLGSVLLKGRKQPTTVYQVILE